MNERGYRKIAPNSTGDLEQREHSTVRRLRNTVSTSYVQLGHDVVHETEGVSQMQLLLSHTLQFHKQSCTWPRLDMGPAQGRGL